jgi:hypothetical protein
MYPRLTLLLVAIFSFNSATPSIAADHAAIAPYLTDDVVGIAYVDLEKIDVSQAIEQIARLNLVPPQEAERTKAEAAATQAMFAELPKRGAKRAYVLLRVKDIFGGGPTWIVETNKAADTAAVMDLLLGWIEKSRSFGGLSDVLPKTMDAEGSLIFGGGSAEGLKELRANRTKTPRADAVAALTRLENVNAGAAVVLDNESRRVVREMFPQLPAPFQEINGALVADGVRWAGVAVNFPPDLKVALIVETTKPEAATTLEQAVSKAMLLAKALLTKESIDGPPVHQARAKGLLPLLSLVAPKVDGSQLSITFGDDEEEVAFLRDFVPAMTQQMRDESYRRSRMNNLKQIGLGMNNHEAARNSYPAAASYDAEGRPLLSWRVHLLPYMEQQALFNQFHLNEPWDSEHNRKLIEQMPELFADPDPAVRTAIGDKGRTTFVAPVGEGMIFGRKEGTKFKELKDGTSNTILVVEVTPERAVVWTKPDDWEVDAVNPLDGVKRSDRDGFVAGWLDGHVSFISNDVEPEKFRGMLTIAGGEASEP